MPELTISVPKPRRDITIASLCPVLVIARAVAARQIGSHDVRYLLDHQHINEATGRDQYPAESYDVRRRGRVCLLSHPAVNKGIPFEVPIVPQAGRTTDTHRLVPGPATVEGSLESKAPWMEQGISRATYYARRKAQNQQVTPGWPVEVL